MQLVTMCNMCEGDLHTSWSPVHKPATIHPQCDTRPEAERYTPHPADGPLASAAYELTLILARAQATPAGSAEWAEFDQQADHVRRVQHDMQNPPLGEVAMFYATECGWPVFPLKAGEKAPATRRGFKDATTNPDQVRAWWEEMPDANIGLPTGSWFDVIDVDTPTMHTRLDELAEDPKATIHAVAHTAGGGYHLYVQPGTGGDKNGVGVFGKGIDYRTKGGYVVAPWSRKANGRVWGWVAPPSTQIRQQQKS